MNIDLSIITPLFTSTAPLPSLCPHLSPHCFWQYPSKAINQLDFYVTRLNKNDAPKALSFSSNASSSSSASLPACFLFFTSFSIFFSRGLSLWLLLSYHVYWLCTYYINSHILICQMLSLSFIHSSFLPWSFYAFSSTIDNVSQVLIPLFLVYHTNNHHHSRTLSHLQLSLHLLHLNPLLFLNPFHLFPRLLS